ncbi:MAG: lysine transporter LysE [Patescibacteria group bacterium]|nr:lysine transporter LysE [Patescibacteria group bacterium]
MHILILFLLGLVAGIALGLPYGPVGFIIIRRFYLFGRISGLISSLGAALSDVFYAVVVGFSLHRIQAFLISISTYTELGAGFVLVWIGIRAMRQKISLDDDETEKHPIQDITSTFIINVLNPVMLFGFALVFTILGKIFHGAPINFVGTLVFIIAIPIGTLLFWLAVGNVIHYLRKKNRHAIVQAINYVTGALLGILGILILVKMGLRLL